jgi:hypothetical protein
MLTHSKQAHPSKPPTSSHRWEKMITIIAHRVYRLHLLNKQMHALKDEDTKEQEVGKSLYVVRFWMRD